MVSYGYQVVAVASAEEARSALATTRFDLLFTDLSLPGESGLDLVRAVRTCYPDLRIVVASGYAIEAIPGVFAQIEKPYDAERLEQILARAHAGEGSG